MKDYAKRPTRSARYQSADGAWFHNLMLLLAISFAGFACVHLIQEYLIPKFKSIVAEKKSTLVKPDTHKKDAVSSLPVKASAKKTASTSSPIKTSTPKPAVDDQPKFDFYKLLPQMTVNVPINDDAATNPALINTKPAPKTISPTYVLQIVSLQNEADATQIQNTLKSNGYSAFLQPYQAPDHTTWYRVLIGPFHDLKTAQAEQDKLDAQQTEALLTTMK